MIEESPYVANLKDAQTGKYIQGNTCMVEQVGVESADDLIGLTVREMIASDVWKWESGPSFLSWQDSLIEAIEKLDYQIIMGQPCADMLHLVFKHNGFIFLKNIRKQAIYDYSRKKVIAVLTYHLDLTHQYSLTDLLHLYLKYYSDREAIQYLLKYLDIDGYFSELPTLLEMRIFCAMFQHSALTDEVTEPHILRLQDRVEQGNWYEMLTRLHAIPSV